MDLGKHFVKFISDHKDSKMLLIQSVKFTKVPSDVYEIENIAQNHFLKNASIYSLEISREIRNLQREIVKGKRYCNNKGEEVCIGIPEEIQGILGLPFNHFEYLQKELNNKENYIQTLKKDKIQLSRIIQEKQELIHLYEKMPIWKRVLFLFGFSPIKKPLEKDAVTSD